MPDSSHKIVILLAGDSGDGVQLLGSQLTQGAAQSGQDVRTLSDFPAEIRAPKGSIAGISGFQFQMASTAVHEPGGQADVLVVFNVAAYVKYRDQLKPGGILLASTDGFDKRSRALAKLAPDEDPLEEARVSFRTLECNFQTVTKEALKDMDLGIKAVSRAKNMVVLGALTWMYAFDYIMVREALANKFSGELAKVNDKAFMAGYYLGETAEWSAFKHVMPSHTLPKGTYRTLSGSQGIAMGLAAVAHQSQRELVFAGYPITPASDILHELVRQRSKGITTFQAEDEIASVTAAIGASFAGKMGVTASSGPGISLKAEGLGLAVMLELPLIVINVQRGGPSTGMPTKMEQSDLMQALHGRHGEAPMPVIAIKSASHAFDVMLMAAKYAMEAMTPVMVLSDAFIASSAEPWRIPDLSKLLQIRPTEADISRMPYERDAKGVRPWIPVGTPGGAHRLGGLEKQEGSGEVSYDADNHQALVQARQAKVMGIQSSYPELTLNLGSKSDDMLVIGWGSTYGSIHTATEQLRRQGHAVAHLHLVHIYPLHPDLDAVMAEFKQLVVVEMNQGQLVNVLRARCPKHMAFIGQTSGKPFDALSLTETLLNTMSS